MLQKKELVILSHLRQDARKNLTSISKETGMPVSTIFDRIKRYEKGLIQKHTALLDFSKLGYDVKVHIALKVPKDKRESFKSYLLREPLVNSVYRINNGYDFMIEAVFRNIKEVHDFIEGLDEYKVKSAEQHFVLEEIKREGFMADPQLVRLMA